MTRSERRRQQEADAAADQRANDVRPNEPPPTAAPEFCSWSRYGQHRYRRMPGGVEVCEFCQRPKPEPRR